MVAADSPLVALIGCLAWIPVAVWIWIMISGAIMNEIDPLVAVIGMGLGVAAGAFVLVKPGHSASLWVVGALWLGLLSFPMLRQAHHRRELAKIDVDAIETAYETLSLRPNSLGPQMRIAHIIYARGLPEHAIGLAKSAVEPYGQKVVADERRQIQLWESRVRVRHGIKVPCANCGHSNPPGPVYCERCGGPFLLFFAKGQWLSATTSRRLSAIFLASLLGSLGIPMASAFFSGQRLIGFIVGILSVAALIVALVFVQTRDREDA